MGGERLTERHGRGEFEGWMGWVGGLAMSFGRGRSVRLVADRAEVRAGDRVVDVGCGPGRFLREAAERGAEAVGVDPSSQMRRLALRRIPARLRGAVRVVDGTAELLPLEDGRRRSPGRSPPSTTGPTPGPGWPSCAGSSNRAGGS
jgi:SAM-dependent methyltransferase